ncbi:TIGR03986 family type III CRISPR-associated RAMP protein [Salinarimonas chemoclinalis]|uniref:TIGR03986 family type III CRISPR-associated RAMP protein n=1 Tax=Salinarimonas chemoclinalis TaxID=3241599 RepID=UPI0035574BBB
MAEPTELPDLMHAPYNFVPLPPVVMEPDWQAAVTQDVPLADGVCGTFPIRIEAVTPLLVGGERVKHDKRPTEVRFLLGPDNVHYLPGSSLKGMIRALVEIASFGRMSAVADRRFPIRDLSAGLSGLYLPRVREVHAGWLRFEGGNWRVTPCHYARIRSAALGIDTQYAPFKFASAKYERFYGLCSSERALVLEKRGLGPDDTILELAPAGASGARKGRIVLTGQPNANRPSERSPKDVAAELLAAEEAQTSGETSSKKTKKHVPKHLDFVFYDREDFDLVIDDDVIKRFRDVNEQADRSVNPQGRGHYETGMSTWDYFKTNRGRNLFGGEIPIFYTKNGRGDITSFGLSRMFPIPSDASVGVILKSTSRQQVALGHGMDLATLMFGCIGDQDTDATAALKGRVSFSHCMVEPGWEPELQPPCVLGPPKASFSPGYLVQPHDGDGRLRGQNYVSWMDSDAKLRGWKRYPVRPPALAGVRGPPPNANVKVQTQLETMPSGSRFTGDVRVHNLGTVELGALLWAITLGGDPARRHAFGMGKPLGLGQIRIEIDEAAWTRTMRANAGGPAPSPSECMRLFEEHMLLFCRRSAGMTSWKQSDPIRTLLAMADPEQVREVKGRPVGPAGLLETMPLADFRRRKGSSGLNSVSQVLMPYLRKPAAGAAAKAVLARKGSAVVYQGEEKVVLLEDLTQAAVDRNAKVNVQFGSDPEPVDARDLSVES